MGDERKQVCVKTEVKMVRQNSMNKEGKNKRHRWDRRDVKTCVVWDQKLNSGPHIC